MSNLVDFLLARIAEDEAAVPSGTGRDPGPVPDGCWDEDRVLTECEAKRRIVEGAQRLREPMPGQDPFWNGAADAITGVLRLLSLPYAEHPEYREDWRV